MYFFGIILYVILGQLLNNYLTRGIHIHINIHKLSGHFIYFPKNNFVI